MKVGGGIYTLGGNLTLANTIVAGNTASTGPDVVGAVTSLGYNLIGNPSGGSGFVSSDLQGVNPLLGPLQNNGGPTETMALLPGSPALGADRVNLAVDANGNALTTDERGSPRLTNGKVDIGAFQSRGFTITVAGGNNQATTVGTDFAAPLVVTVSSPDGAPVAGGVVTFTVPATGHSATFPGGSSTAAINASGQAAIAVAANSVPGSYAVNASATGAASTSFDATNTQGVPTKLVIHTEPSATATAGLAFATQPVIYVEDQSGYLETGDNSMQVTVSLASGAGALEETLNVTASGGIASFTNLADNTAGTISLLFKSVQLTSASSGNIVISPAQPSQLVIQTQPPATATAGQAFVTQPVIYVEDQYGNLETGDNTTKVTVSLRTGAGPLEGNTTATAAQGIVTFTGLADKKAETITLLFTGPGLTKATSSSITISSGSAQAKLVRRSAKVTDKNPLRFRTAMWRATLDLANRLGIGTKHEHNSRRGRD